MSSWWLSLFSENILERHCGYKERLRLSQRKMPWEARVFSIHPFYKDKHIPTLPKPIFYNGPDPGL